MLFKKRVLAMIVGSIITSLGVGCSQVSVTQTDGVPTYVLEVDTKQVAFDINQDMYGLFFEDINKAADGGLNPELLENKSFEQVREGAQGIFGWQIESASEKNTYHVAQESGLHENNPHYLQLSVADTISLRNIGHNGVPMQQGEVYGFSIWVDQQSFDGSIEVWAENMAGKAISTREAMAVQNTSGTWQKYSCEITGLEKGIGQLILKIQGSGEVAIDFASLMSTDTWYGTDKEKWLYGGLRKDLVQALYDAKPGFIRFPGGCVAEGEGLDNLYRWKDTIGPVEMRKEQQNTWGYWQSYGVGYHEYFQLCEDLGAEPMPVVHAGITCQIRRPGEHYAIDSLEFEESLQDALDLIEYANGDVSTYWGSKRAENGHIEPFNLKYVAVGNENWGAEYFSHFEKFKQRIEEVYPDIVVITSSGPWASGPEYDYAWEQVNENYPDVVVDEHFYMTPEWFLGNADRYDYYKRTGAKVFVGEYAAHNGKVNTQVAASGNTLYSALAEAAFMTGFERNGDIVEMASYAPLLAKQGDSQWFYNMIWFDHFDVVYTPNYYVQQLFSQHTGDQLISASLTDAKGNTLSSESGGILLGGWSTAVEYDWIQVISNKDGRILFEDDFEDGEIDERWQIKAGTWKEEGGVLKQTSTTNGEKSIWIEGPDWEDYTLKVKAKKTGGAEGFLIGVGVRSADDFTWYNAGGWGNTKDAIERSIAGTKGSIGFVEPGSFAPIQTFKEYTIDISYAKDHLRVTKEQVCIQDTAFTNKQKDIYTSVTHSSEKDETYIKLVNVQEHPVNIQFDIKDHTAQSPAEVVTLTHENPGAVNSFKNPNMIKPTTHTVDFRENNTMQLEPYSLKIIALKNNK